MAKVYSFFADGLEEVEALTPVDLLRRAGNEVVTVSVMGRLRIRGSHNIYIEADALFTDLDFADGDLFILPGGREGTKNLAACEPLRTLLVEKYTAVKRIAAICAAPSVLGSLGFLRGKKAVAYPGFESALIGAEVLNVPAVTDGTITTGHGVGAAFDFALELIRVLNGQEAYEEMKKKTVFQH